MVENQAVLGRLLGQGRLDQLEELAQAGYDLLHLEWEGLNLVTASVLADSSPELKLELVQRAGALVPDPVYPVLFAHRFRLLHPRRARELKDAGVELTAEVRSALSQDWDLFDLLFAVLPLSLGGDVLAYALSRGLTLCPSDISRLKSCAAGLGEGSPREIDDFFAALLGA